MSSWICISGIQNTYCQLQYDPNRNNQMVNDEGNVKADNACVHKHYAKKAQGS